MDFCPENRSNSDRKPSVTLRAGRQVLPRWRYRLQAAFASILCDPKAWQTLVSAFFPERHLKQKRNRQIINKNRQIMIFLFDFTFYYFFLPIFSVFLSLSLSFFWEFCFLGVLFPLFSLSFRRQIIKKIAKIMICEILSFFSTHFSSFFFLFSVCLANDQKREQ